MKIDREYPDSLLIEDHFKNHKITLHENIGTEIGRLEYMRWQKPGSWVCGVDYLVRSGNLIVTGDLGEAIYCWHGNKVSLEWISGLDLYYFHGKCQASENGRNVKNYDWSEEKARRRIFEHFKDYYDCKSAKKFKDMNPPIHNEREFVEWINANHDDVSDMFGIDYWEFLYSCGRVIPARTRLHLLGLKLAFNKIKK
jgi:hypothetical protein